MFEVGKTAEITVTVDNTNTAKTMGSGSLEVFATPAMVALMEKSACECVKDMLEEGTTTVGTKICTEHIAATPVNMEVTCKCTLTAAEGRKLLFEIEAFDKVGIIGKASHERFIVQTEKFIKKTYDKANVN